jgi:hypothetical protein
MFVPCIYLNKFLCVTAVDLDGKVLDMVGRELDPFLSSNTGN